MKNPTRQFNMLQTTRTLGAVVTNAFATRKPDDNPNTMPPHQYASLLAHMLESRCKVLQPILTRPSPDDYPRGANWETIVENDGPDTEVIIVDGVHRVRAAKEAAATLGIEDTLIIPVMLTDMSEDEARFYRLAMNRIRGNADPERVGVELSLLEAAFGAEMLVHTGFEAHEIEHLMRAATDIDAEEIMRGGITGNEDSDDTPEVLPVFELKLFFATSEQLKKVKRALRRAAGKGAELGSGLVKIIEGET